MRPIRFGLTIILVLLIYLSISTLQSQSQLIITDWETEERPTDQGLENEYQIPVQPFSAATSCSLKKEDISQLAQGISVKIYAGETSGSGIIIKQENDNYLVVTNHHVIIFADQPELELQTVDNQTHWATKVQTINFEGLDLALLKFRSDRFYPVATVSPLIELNTPVFAYGFPVSEVKQREFMLTQGKITIMTLKPLEGGYQIGYNNQVKKGMSGGPVLNCDGQVIAINGRSTSLWGTPSFKFIDGTSADEISAAKMNPLSWAIPIQTLLNKLKPITIVNY